MQVAKWGNSLAVRLPAAVVEAPARLQLKEEPKADVARYDRLLKKLAVAAIAVGREAGVADAAVLFAALAPGASGSAR